MWTFDYINILIMTKLPLGGSVAPAVSHSALHSQGTFISVVTSLSFLLDIFEFKLKV